MAATKAIGELLVKENKISLDQLEQARKSQRQSGDRLTSALVTLGYMGENDLAEFIAEQYKLPSIDLSIFECDAEALKTLPAQVCKKHNVIPVTKADKTLVVAFADPSNIYVKEDLSLLTRCKIEVVVASEISIQKAIEKYYNISSGSQIANIMSEMEDDQEFTAVNVLNQAAATIGGDADPNEGPIVKFVSAMLSEAVKSGASDIHVEPYEKRFRIRFRIDGKLEQKTQPPQGAANAIVSRIKIMSKLDIAERRRPQDGRLKVRTSSGKDVDFRVSVLPTLFGEKIVMRILDKGNLQLDLTTLKFEDEQLQAIESAISMPQGMVLITGPTGSGKTTTIYSCLAKLNTPDTNISTAEDPVEFNLDGINQVQIKAEIGFGFAEALRSFLRQDPDIVMVGEIRDLETANVAYKAASTGHLVVSTLHTNDAASTVSRLIDMGVPNFMVAEATTLVVAQRLMRSNCTKCLVEVKVPRETLLEIGVKEEDLGDYTNLKKGQGCPSCNHTGLSGRVAIIEVLQMTSEVKEAIFAGSSPLQIKRQAILSGMKSLRMSALAKMKRGMTTVEQVISSTVGDDI